MPNHDPANPGTGNYDLIVWRLEQLEAGQEKLENGQNDLKEGQDKILELLRAVPRCPHPGSCDNLSKDLLDLSTRLKKLEDDKIKISAWLDAGTWIGKAIYILAAAGVFQLLVNAYEFFKR